MRITSLDYAIAVLVAIMGLSIAHLIAGAHDRGVAEGRRQERAMELVACKHEGDVLHHLDGKFYCLPQAYEPVHEARRLTADEVSCVTAAGDLRCTNGTWVDVSKAASDTVAEVKAICGGKYDPVPPASVAPR